MITSKKDFLNYLVADKQALGRTTKRPKINDYIWKYEILLRKCEYYQNVKRDRISRLIFGLLRLRRSKIGLLCGFEIPLNVVDQGLCLAHAGTVIISEHAHIGKNCKIHAGVNIGADARKRNAAPCIGDNVYIGPGAKLFGEIILANGIAIGANAVVNKSFISSDISIGGIPAKEISNRGSEGIIANRRIENIKERKAE